MRSNIHVLNLISAAYLLAGCAFSEDVAEVKYTPITATTIATAGPVALAVSDARTSNRMRIAMKMNGYGMDGAAIRTTQPVLQIVQDALTTEFQQRGFTLAPNGEVISIAVDKFYTFWGIGAPSGSAVLAGVYSGDAHGLVDLTVSVGAGGAAFRRQYHGVGNANVILTNGSNAARVVSAGLQDAIGKMFADPEFLASVTHPVAS